jgi:hypothetical protein
MLIFKILSKFDSSRGLPAKNIREWFYLNDASHKALIYFTQDEETCINDEVPRYVVPSKELISDSFHFLGLLHNHSLYS